jgi:6,7-dimethyl-8-ribityllumazine synthase
VLFNVFLKINQATMASAGNQAILQFSGEQWRHLPVAVVRTAWNEDITAELQAGCARVLEQAGVAAKYFTVPGAVELTFAASALHRQQCYSAIVVLGCVIKGDTPHFEYVCQSVTQGIAQLNVTANIPVIFGVLTVHTAQQAWERLGGVHGHKGEEAAYAALQMATFAAGLKS